MTIKSLDLQEEVIEELAFDPRVYAEDIGVSINEGIVTLRGTVPSFGQKWEAEDAVKRVRGVRGVADELVVDLPSAHLRTDTDIALAIEHRFSSNMSIPASVKFTVKDGNVTLSGDVPWYYQMQEAAHEARRVVGVKSVGNLITVKPEKTLTNNEIKLKIESEFQRMADLDAKNVNVSAFEGTVNLSGSVRSWAEKEKAAQAAWSLPGVTRVDNLLGVNP
jgi:osmotically-inducible protein OsmY